MMSTRARLYNESPCEDAPKGTSSALSLAVISGTIFALGVGTGGVLDPSYFQQRGNKGYAYPTYRAGDSSSFEAALPTEDSKNLADQISYIREASRFSVSKLAGIFGVTRQTIYDWQAGKNASEENTDRVREISSAFDLLLKSGIDIDRGVMVRPIYDGKNLLELIVHGEDAEQTTSKLLNIIRRENEERELLRKRLAGRKKPSLDVYADAGNPTVNEES